MACYHPLRGYRPPDGGPLSFHEVKNSLDTWVACGQCIGCRLERSRQWAVRIVHESKMHDDNCFLTLTYRPDALPANGSLHYPDVQLFLKKLRRVKRFRYVCCGEYGEQLQRPHYHLILFGFDFRDKREISEQNGIKLFTSRWLEVLWPHGFNTIGAVTPESARYVAQYSLKKVTGRAASEHYRRVDPETGEVVEIEPEFLRMSLKPGIGATWFEKFSRDVYPRGKVVHNGKEAPPPRYYEKLYERINPDKLDELQADRQWEMSQPKKRAEQSYRRLADREQVVQARQKLKRRT